MILFCGTLCFFLFFYFFGFLCGFGRRTCVCVCVFLLARKASFLCFESRVISLFLFYFFCLSKNFFFLSSDPIACSPHPPCFFLFFFFFSSFLDFFVCLFVILSFHLLLDFPSHFSSCYFFRFAT